MKKPVGSSGPANDIVEGQSQGGKLSTGGRKVGGRGKTKYNNKWNKDEINKRNIYREEGRKWGKIE
jgi:predicted metal-dependent phosphoesterase TrpH